MSTVTYERDYFQESTCVRMRVHMKTVFVTYTTQVHTANMRCIMAIIQYHFSNLLVHRFSCAHQYSDMQYFLLMT
jgi:hypothetical protein